MRKVSNFPDIHINELTTADQDDWCQRLAEIRQLHESFLNDLEGLAVEAIASNDWNAFYAHLIDFQSQHDLHGITGIAVGDDELEATTKDLDRQGDGFFFPQPTTITIDKD